MSVQFIPHVLLMSQFGSCCEFFHLMFHHSILKVEIKKAEPRDASKAQEEGGQWGTHPDNHWGMPVGPPGMPGLNNVSTSGSVLSL